MVNILGIVLFAFLGFVLADGGITISDKPVHFLTILAIALLIEFNTLYTERKYGNRNGN